jgi:hypothetical protein
VPKPIKNIIAIVVVVIVAVFYADEYNTVENGNATVIDTQTDVATNDKLLKLIKHRQSGQMVVVNVTVLKLLSDDLQGDRHQRMILKVVGSGKTILLAHNIDIANRIPVQVGQELVVYGQYEWNDKGGVIHWTHRDNNNRHPNGWVLYNNNRYQ